MNTDPAPRIGTATGVRELADAHLREVARVSPLTALALGLPGGEPGLDDLSPQGADRRADVDRRTLTALDRIAGGRVVLGGPRAAVVPGGPDVPGGSGGSGISEPAETETPADPAEAACARLLRERLTARLAVHDAGEGLRNLSNLDAPAVVTWMAFSELPAVTDPRAGETEHETLVRLLEQVPDAFDGWTDTLRAGVAARLPAGPRSAEAVTELVGRWLATDYWTTLVARVPASLRSRAEAAAAGAVDATGSLHQMLRREYLPACAGAPDGVGAERYAMHVRLHSGASPDLRETYEWGWQELARVNAEMRAEAEKVRPGAGVDVAFAHLDGPEGDAIVGTAEVRAHLQWLMDTAMDQLDGRYFDISGQVRRVESMLAPDGGAASPYYTQPSLDFSRPGRTWLPTLGRERFPLWDLVSTWYHEGVPGHHLQFARWIQRRGTLSDYQISLGTVSAMIEGWALYAERLADEVGLLRTPGERMGYLDAQRLRAVRVVLDIGMHCGFDVPAGLTARDAGTGVSGPAAMAGARLDPEVGAVLLRANCASPQEFIDSEIVRYLGLPGQAIGYKLGERAWLAGRDAARVRAGAQGREFDLRAWHMAALDLGSLGLEDLVPALTALG